MSEHCNCGEPTEKLATAFAAAMNRLDFRYFALCSRVDPLDPPPSAVMLHNYPVVWMRAFGKARLYEIDPILLRAEHSPLPFFWDDGNFRAQLTPLQVQLLAEANRFGLRFGYTIPILVSWMSGALRASCSLVPSQ